MNAPGPAVRLSFGAELQRRNVHRAAIFYSGTAWLLVQIATQVLPFFHIEEGVVRWVVIAAVTGFPFAMLFSWFYEWTPQGIKRESGIDHDAPATRRSGRTQDLWIIAVLGAAVVVLLASRFISAEPPKARATVDAESIDKSIAVLPFENRSSDPANAFFAAGIQDELLTRLAKIGALKVISRTSTARYASSPDNLPEIARQLGVANILEGSVQRIGDAVHVNVQLIRAASDDHLWAESYDRKLADVFGVEAEVAGAIAATLNAKLSGAEQAALAVRPTENAAAYDSYLRGLALEGRVDAMTPTTLDSIKAFDEAVKLDPGFALAWAHLSRQHGFAFISFEPTAQHREAAKQALDQAIRFGPALVESRLAEGYYRYWVEHDYAAAKTLFEALRGQYPNNPWAPYALACIARRQGDWAQSRRLFAAAIELSPQDVVILRDAALADLSVLDMASALQRLDRILLLRPGSTDAIVLKSIALQMNGDIAASQALLVPIEPADGDSVLVSQIVLTAILARTPRPAIALLQRQIEKQALLGSDLGSYLGMLGDLQQLDGDAAAPDTYRKARVALIAALREEPDDPDTLGALALVETGLANKAAALDYARRAATLVPSSKDAVVGPGYEELLARVEARFGDRDEAIAALRRLLNIAYRPPRATVPLLRVDPDWDRLRDDPRFQQLLADAAKPMAREP